MRLTEVMHVRVSKAHLAVLEAEADDVGVKVATYVRMLVLRSLQNAPQAKTGKLPREREERSRAPARRDARRLGKRFSEIAGKAHGMDASTARKLSPDS